MVGSSRFPLTFLGKIGTFLLLSHVELLAEGLNEKGFRKRKPFFQIQIRDHTKLGFLLLGQVWKFHTRENMIPVLTSYGRDFNHVMEIKEFE